MAFGATYDACVLHSAALRDFLVRLAGTGLFRANTNPNPSCPRRRLLVVEAGEECPVEIGGEGVEGAEPFGC